MKFRISAAGVPIGFSELEHYDDGMNIRTADTFKPTEDYERVRPVFRWLFDSLDGDKKDELTKALEAASRAAIEALKLEVRVTGTDELVPGELELLDSGEGDFDVSLLPVADTLPRKSNGTPY